MLPRIDVRHVLPLAAVILAAACGAPPARWAEGGAPLDIPVARWSGGRASVDVAPDGAVRVNDEKEFTIDRGGRVRDANGDAFAMLDVDGRLVGVGDAKLGHVSESTAASDDGKLAITVSRTGEIFRRGDDGEHGIGTWRGDCARSPATARACTLVTYLVIRGLDQLLERRDKAEYRRTRTHPR